MSKLRIVSDAEQAPLRDQISLIVDDHRTEVIETVRKWILYWVHLGARKLTLDDCPTITARDREYVVDWLRQEGFVVSSPRTWGRVIIHLQPELRPMDVGQPGFGGAATRPVAANCGEE